VLCWKAPGDVVRAGDRIGMIRFGSRVDVWLPAAAEIVVGMGDRVLGGETILARWR
jgi:phosphatidylserine decarboxylase